MAYTLQWGQVVGFTGYLIGGAWLALQMAFLAFGGGVTIATINATVLSYSKNRALRGVVNGYVAS